MGRGGGLSGGGLGNGGGGGDGLARKVGRFCGFGGR